MRRCDGGGRDLGANADGDEDEEAEPAGGVPPPDQGRHNDADQGEGGEPVRGKHLEVEPGVAEEVGPAEAGATELDVLEDDDEQAPEHQSGGRVEPGDAAAIDEGEGDHDGRDGDRDHDDALVQRVDAAQRRLQIDLCRDQRSDHHQHDESDNPDETDRPGGQKVHLLTSVANSSDRDDGAATSTPGPWEERHLSLDQV